MNPQPLTLAEELELEELRNRFKLHARSIRLKPRRFGLTTLSQAIRKDYDRMKELEAKRDWTQT